MKKISLPCRLCLSNYSKSELSNVFTCKINHTEDSLVDVLFWIFSVEIDVTDPHAKDICEECLVLIEYVVEVRNMFRKNQETLKNVRHENPLENWGVKSLDTIEESNPNDEEEQPRCNTPSASNQTKSSYGTSSPRVRVTLSTLESLCPMTLNIEKLETSSEYMRYKQLGNGRFKKRKYRHFDLDDDIWNDICNTLTDFDEGCVSTGPFKKDVGVAKDASFESKGVNTEESYISISKSFNGQLLNIVDVKYDESLTDFLQLTKNISSSMLSPNANKEDDWTKLTFQKDASTNTELNSVNPKRSIGINATAESVDVGTLTKAFKQMKKKNEVKVNINNLDSFSPKVWLEPVEYLLGREDYAEIGDFSFVKNDIALQNEPEQDESDQSFNEMREDIINVKKQRFLDYYNNFSSFAVRELIAGKQIRESSSDSSPILKVADVCDVFVCTFCSKTFLTKTVLNLHTRQAHRQATEGGPSSDSTFSRFRKRKRGRRVKTNSDSISVEPHNNTEDVRTDLTKEFKKTLSSSGDTAGKNIKRTHALGLKRRDDVANCNVNKTLSVKINRETEIKRRTGRPRSKSVASIEQAEESSYIWERKDLGKYSAISFYRKQNTESPAPATEANNGDLTKKPDTTLDETIRRLSVRLEETEKSTNDAL